MNRRDFLKLGAVVENMISDDEIAAVVKKLQDRKLILIFDSWSASNTSLYGYPRKTTPNIDRLAEKAIVYHNHYASGHYTYPSTASLLTGVLPWTHKGYWDNPKGQILAAYNSNNLFSHFSSHFRTGYSHNALANSLLMGMSKEQDNFVPRDRLAIPNNQLFEVLFRNDPDISLVSWIRNLEFQQTGHAKSLFLSRLYSYDRQKKQAEFSKLFPRGLPALTDKDNFLLETAIDWIIENSQATDSPQISYVHLLPPHSPYNTRSDFIDVFRDDSYTPIKKTSICLERLYL